MSNTEENLVNDGTKEISQAAGPGGCSLLLIGGLPFIRSISGGVEKYVYAKEKEKEFDGYEAASLFANSLLKDQPRGILPTEVKDADIVEAICTLLKKYIFLEHEEDYVLVSMYGVLTYCYEMFNRIPYLKLSGRQGSGKTTLMQLMSLFVSRPQLFSSVTDASIFRVIDTLKPTLILDEAEKLGGSFSSNILTLQIINSGYQKDGKAVRTIKGDVVEFSTFGPKILGAITSLAPTIEDRCLILNMKAPDNKLQAFLNTASDIAESERINEMIHAWISRHAIDIFELSGSVDKVPVNPLIRNRDLDKWFPLLVLSKLFSNHGKDYLTMMNNYAGETIRNKQENEERRPENVCKKVIVDYIRAKRDDPKIVPRKDNIFYYVLAEEFMLEVSEKDSVNSYARQADVTNAMKKAGINSSRQRFAPYFPGPVIVYKVPVGLVD